MAKKIINEVEQVNVPVAKKNTKKPTTLPKEESHVGLIATVIAIVALLVIGGTIGAFVLFLKAKSKYNDLISAGKNNVVAPVSIGVGQTSADNGIWDLAENDTSMNTGTTMPQDESSSTIPSSTVPVVSESAESDVPDVPEPEKVGKYNFDNVIAEMDGAINQTVEESVSMSEFSDSSVGL